MAKAAQPKTVIFYKDGKGRVPVKDWLYGLKDIQGRRRILRRLRHVEQGNYGDCKGITGRKGLMELRFDVGPGYRMYFAEDGDTLVVLLAGGDKKTQTQDIENAAASLKDYKEYKRYETLSDT